MVLIYSNTWQQTEWTNGIGVFFLWNWFTKVIFWSGSNMSYTCVNSLLVNWNKCVEEKYIRWLYDVFLYYFTIYLFCACLVAQNNDECLHNSLFKFWSCDPIEKCDTIYQLYNVSCQYPQKSNSRKWVY